MSRGDADDYIIYNDNGRTQVSCDMSNGGWTKVVNVPADTHETEYAIETAVSHGIHNGPDTFWKFSDDDINAMDGAGYFQYRCGTCVDRFFRTTEGRWSSARDNGLHWEEDRDKDEIFECDAVARSNYVFSDYPATPLVDGADCGTSIHTNYGEGSDATGCYAAACGGWGLPASVWIKGPDVCVPLDGEPQLNGNPFYTGGASAADYVSSGYICASMGMVYNGGSREDGRREVDFIWYPISRTDVCVALNTENQYHGTVLDIQGPPKDKMCLNKYAQVDSEPIVSRLQCDCG